MTKIAPSGEVDKNEDIIDSARLPGLRERYIDGKVTQGGSASGKGGVRPEPGDLLCLSSGKSSGYGCLLSGTEGADSGDL